MSICCSVCRSTCGGSENNLQDSTMLGTQVVRTGSRHLDPLRFLYRFPVFLSPLFCVVYVCVSLRIYATYIWVPLDTRRECHIPWSWSSRHLWATWHGTTWVLWKDASTLNCWVFRLWPGSKCLLPLLEFSFLQDMVCSNSFFSYLLLFMFSIYLIELVNKWSKVDEGFNFKLVLFAPKFTLTLYVRYIRGTA